MLEEKEEFRSALFSYDFPSISPDHLSLLVDFSRKDCFDEYKLLEKSFAASILCKWLKILMG